METPTLVTQNLVIRAFEKKDLQEFTRYRADESVAKYQSWSDYTEKDALHFFNYMDYSVFALEDRWYQLAITTREGDKLLGDLAVHFIDRQQVEIGFTISPLHQRKHVATEAATSLLTYLFNVLNIHRVIATTDTRNTASYRLLEKLGFRREAHFIQNIMFKGDWGDEYQYALLQSDTWCDTTIK